MNQVLQLAVCLPLLLILGCGGGSSQLQIVVPQGFRGPVKLVLDPDDGVDVSRSGSIYAFDIPKDGVLRLRSFAPFQEDWHAVTGRFDDGSRLPTGFASGRDSAGTIDPTKVVLSGGELTTSGDGAEVITYYVGTVDEYDEWYSQEWAKKNVSQ